MTAVLPFRQFFATMPGLLHLNNAGLSPINIEAEAVVHHWVSRYRSEGMFCNDAYLEAVEKARQQLADFLDAELGSIAFFPCTSAAISQVAFELPLSPGDEVLMWDQEYGSNLYPWQEAARRTGANLVLAESDREYGTPVDRLLQGLSSRTKVISISWVQFQTGAHTDLSALAQIKQQRPDVWLVLDGIQGIGIHPFSFRQSGFDVLLGGSHKWMTSPVGVGYLCIRPELVSALRPHNIGAATYGTCDDPTDLGCKPKLDATRFESGSKQVLEILALGASAQLIHRCGVGNIETEALRLAQRLLDGLEQLQYKLIKPNGSRVRSPIINMQTTAHSPLKDLDMVAKTLQAHHISFARRGPGIRLSPHAHNCIADIDRVLAVLAEPSKGKL